MSFADERVYRVIQAPILSEQSMQLADKFRQFVFYVVNDATKAEIKKAVAQLFNVEVHAVRVLRTKGKARRFKNNTGHTKTRKKAYVTLKPGFDISFATAQ